MRVDVKAGSDNAGMFVFPRWRVAAVALTLCACTPALDWREVAVDAKALTALFPCRPDRRVREVALADSKVRMEMVSCVAGATTFAVSFVDVAEPSGVAKALEALHNATTTNVGASSPSNAPFVLRGATPNPATVRVHADGRLPDGGMVRADAAFFARGLRAYQASVIGAAPGAEAVETFFAGLKLGT